MAASYADARAPARTGKNRRAGALSLTVEPTRERPRRPPAVTYLVLLGVAELGHRAAVIELAIEALSSVCATDFKAGEIEIGICSTAEEEPVPEGVSKGEGLFRQMGEEERGEWLVRVGEKD